MGFMSDYTGHTPGPWNENAIRALLRFGRKNDGDWDSSIYWENENLNMPSDADARLIAAAPELLAERDRLREALKEIAALDYSKAAINGSAYQATRIARTALKQTGGNQ